jgi:hypothetical protein
MKLQVGWVDRIAPAVATKDEHARATAMGLEPRRNFPIDRARRSESAARGGRLGRKRRLYKADGK